MIAISPAAKLLDLESLAILSRLTADAAAVNAESLNQQGAPDVSTSVCGIKQRKT